MYRGGFLACHRTDDYAMLAEPTGRRGWKRSYSNLELAQRVEQRPLSFGASEGQECVLKEPSIFRSVASCCRRHDASNSACLPRDPIVAPGASFHACHDFLPVTRVHQSRSRAFCFAFVVGKAFWDPPPQDPAWCLLSERKSDFRKQNSQISVELTLAFRSSVHSGDAGSL